MEDEDHHFPPDMKSCQCCQNLTSYNTWSTWDSSSKASQTTVFPEDSPLMIILSMAGMEKQDLQYNLNSNLGL